MFHENITKKFLIQNTSLLKKKKQNRTQFKTIEKYFTGNLQILKNGFNGKFLMAEC